MAHGSASNFIRQTVGSSVGTTDPETIDVSDASAFPDPNTSQYDIVIWDAGSFNRPDQDSNVEVLTVTGRDTGNNTLTCARGQQGTTNTSHPSTSDVIIAPLSVGDFNSIDTVSGTIDGNKDIPGVPSTSSDPNLSFGTWRQTSSTRPAIVLLDIQTETDGTNLANCPIDVDESGGTTGDYTLNAVEANPDAGSGFRDRESVTLTLPAGAQYRVRNENDPNNANQILDTREFVL